MHYDVSAAARRADGIDYSRIYAERWRGEAIGRAYLEAQCQPENGCVKRAYEAFAEQVDAQYRYVRQELGVRHFVTDEDPYPMEMGLDEAFHAMCRDIRHKGLVTLSSAEYPHPLLSCEVNDKFRFVHDYFGHYRSGRGFDRHGEEAAWVAHAHMFTPLARRAMTTETRGQNSAMCWVAGDFVDQKAVLLPSGASELRWSAK